MENYNQQAPVPQYIGFGDAIKICLNKYADFKGRAGRAEFWWWYLFTVIISLGFSFLTLITGSVVFSYISYVVSLGLLVPGLAVAWRRLHDIGKAGGWYFIGLIPIVGWIILIIWLAGKGEPCPNRFGNPVA